MKIPSVLQRLIWGVIPALLILAGQWLAEDRTGEKAVLYYSVTRSDVGQLKALHLILRNTTKIAIDELTIKVPIRDLIKSAFEPAGTTGASAPHIWKGQLPSESILQAVLVYEGIAPTNSEFTKNIIFARYQSRDGSGGILQ